MYGGKIIRSQLSPAEKAPATMYLILRWPLPSEKKMPQQPGKELDSHLQMRKLNLREPSVCVPLQAVSAMFFPWTRGG